MARISEELVRGIPIFGGADAYDWTHSMERFFLLKKVREEDKMQATMEALEGRALAWLQWWMSCNPNPSWEGFKIAVVRRFQPSKSQNPFELLLSLKQNGKVEDYVVEFEKYVGALRGIDPEFVRGIFLKGLSEEIQAEVRSGELHSLSEVFQEAILIEQERRGSKLDSAAEKNRTFEAEASPENLETMAVRAIQGESNVEAPQKSEAASEAERAAAKLLQRPSKIAAPHKPNRDAAETEHAAAVAIQRFDLEKEGEPAKLKEERAFLEAKTLDLSLSTPEKAIRPPAKPPKPPCSALDIAKLEEVELCPLWSCWRVARPVPPPAKPPELWRDGGRNLAPLDLSSCEGMGTHGHSARTERAEIKVWTCNPNGPSPNLSWKELGLDEYRANFSAFGLKSNLPIDMRQQEASQQESQVILKVLWESNSGDFQVLAEIVELTTDVGNEEEQWDPGGSCDYCHFCIVSIAVFWVVHCFSLYLSLLYSKHTCSLF